jgi:hypothetical protein
MDVSISFLKYKIKINKLNHIGFQKSDAVVLPDQLLTVFWRLCYAQNTFGENPSPEAGELFLRQRKHGHSGKRRISRQK